MTLKSPSPQPNLGRANMIVGVGTDIVEIPRIGKMIARHGEHFLTRVYTDEEIRYCQRRLLVKEPAGDPPHAGVQHGRRSRRLHRRRGLRAWRIRQLLRGARGVRHLLRRRRLRGRLLREGNAWSEEKGECEPAGKWHA